MDTNSVFAIFPGQGSQKVGMGKDIDHPICRDYFERADKSLGFSLSTLCFEGPQEDLTSTSVAQPAILTVSVISYEIAREQMKSNLKVVCGAGHSLGEYSALVAAGAIAFEDAVQLVNKRGTYMQEAVPVGKGKMAAVLGKEIAEIEDAIAKVSGVVSIANDNAPGQVVVAGTKEGVEEFLQVLPNAKAKLLDVSAPFHCSLMKPAEDNLRKDLASLSISAPSFPIIANVTAKEVREPGEVKELLARQVCGRVKWVESVQYGVSKYSPTTAIEFGAGAVLTGLLKRITPDLPRVNFYDGAPKA